MLEGSVPVDRLRYAYEQWEATRGASGDLFVELMADDVRMRTVLGPTEQHPLAIERLGKENARDYLISLALNLEMIDFPTQEIVVQGDTAVWIGSCTWRDPRNGREAHTEKVDVWRFRDGKAVSALEMFDTLGFARFVGLVKA